MPPAPEPKGYSVNRFVCKSCVVCLSLLPVFFLKIHLNLSSFQALGHTFGGFLAAWRLPWPPFCPPRRPLEPPRCPRPSFEPKMVPQREPKRLNLGSFFHYFFGQLSKRLFGIILVPKALIWGAFW